MHTNLKFKFKILIPSHEPRNSRQKYNLKYHLPLHCPCPFTSPFSIVALKIQIKFRLDNKKNRIAFVRHFPKKCKKKKEILFLPVSVKAVQWVYRIFIVFVYKIKGN